MKSPQHRLTRAELYKLVWSEPVSKIAPRFGISDVGFSKLCRRVDVPLPPQGYWVKLKYGKHVPKPRLKPAANGDDETVLITESEKAATEVPDDIAASIAYEADSNHQIAVPVSTTRWHPIVAKWFEEDKHPQQPIYGFATRVKVDALERRRRILVSVLLQAFEKRGWAVAAKDRYDFTVHMFGETVEFRIDRRMRQVRVPLTPAEQQYMHGDDKVVTEATDELRIRLRRNSSYGARDWTDKPDTPVELRLGDAIIGMLSEANKSRIRNAEYAERERQWEIESQARADAAERRRQEQGRVNALLSASDRWVQAQRLREYARYVSAHAAADADMEEWTSWAMSVADRLDPTTSKGQDLAPTLRTL
jgi:hypothetical protein